MPGTQFSVLNNLNSMFAQQNLYQTNIGLNKALARLSSGKRIVDASDDAAGLFSASSLQLDMLAYAQATRNANDGISVVSIADGALSKLTDLLARGITLASSSASGMVGDVERRTLNTEYQQILSEVDRVVSSANFRGETLFKTDEAFVRCLFVGDTNRDSWITVSIGGGKGAGTVAMGLRAATGDLVVSVSTTGVHTTTTGQHTFVGSALVDNTSSVLKHSSGTTDGFRIVTADGVTHRVAITGANDSLNGLAASINALGINVNATVTADHRLQLAATDNRSFQVNDQNVGTNMRDKQHDFDQASSHIKDIDSAIKTMTLLQNAVASISRWRGAIGAQQSRLINSVDIIGVQSLNLRSAMSQITDANMAEEVVNMTKWQILMQSGMAALSQANTSSQQVLSLFR